MSIVAKTYDRHDNGDHALIFRMRRQLHKFLYASVGLILVLILLWIYRWDSLWMTRQYCHFFVPDEYAVFSATIDFLWTEFKGLPKAVLVVDETAPDRDPNFKSVWSNIRPKGHMLALTQKTIDDFTIQNTVQYRLRRNIIASTKCIPISESHLGRIIRSGGLNWAERVESEYPGVWFVISLSRVGFSKDFSQAVVWIDYCLTGGSGGDGSYILLEKRNNKWMVVDGYQLFIH
jgi:hypothetical protein